MIKYYILLGLTLLLRVSIFGCAVWTIIEFILYLSKDDPFNWNSLYFTMASVVAQILVVIWTLAKLDKDNKKLDKLMKDKKSSARKSKFQQRLEEMQNKNNQS